MAGPLLAPGLVLTVDLSVVPHPHLPSLYWGLPTGTHGGPADRLPFDLLFVAAGHLDAVAVLEKCLLLAIVFLAGYGMHRLLPVERETARFFGGVLYAVNPFVYDRLLTGQWYLLLGYALLPWAFEAFRPVARGDWRAAWRFSLLATLVGAASPHMLALLAVLALVEGTLRLRREGFATVRAATLAAGLTCCGSLYWLLPSTGVEDLWRHVSGAQLALYQTVSDPRLGVVANVLGLYGYWNDAAPVKAYVPLWPLLALALLALSALGLAYRRRSSTAVAVAVAGLAGLALALGGRGPTGALFRALIDHVAAARSFREPQKGVALVVFAYAFLGAAAVDGLVRRLRASGRMLAPAFSVVLLALPLIYGYRELGGLWGALRTSSYPASWTAARTILRHEAGASNTLFLPWHGYMALGFAHHRVVANPAAAFFDTPIVASRSVGEGAAVDNSDPRDIAVTQLLAAGASSRTLGACLATLGISHVLVADVADFSRYGFLNRQRDLVVERRWPGLTLYRNTHPTGLVLTAASTPTGLCADRVRPLAASRRSPAHLEIVRPPARGETVVLAQSYRPDWRLGSARPRPYAGGAATAFSAPGRSASIELTTAGANGRDYVIGLVALALVLLSAGLGRRRRPFAPIRLPSSPEGWSPRTWVVLPTYNEADNVAPMVAAIRESTDAAGLDVTILVVDDGSPDGTGAIADSLAARHPNVHVLHRHEKEGLGPAYAAGFAYALARAADLLVQMDCDFSHDPADLPRLVAAARHADLVLGSRYVRGGGVRDWGIGRRVLSRGGSLYARLVLGLPYADLTGGFKCFRSSAIAKLDPSRLRASGYAFQIETTYRAHALGLHVTEIPIVFRDRRKGASKMSPSIALEALLLVPQLRLLAAQPGTPAQEGQAATAVP